MNALEPIRLQQLREIAMGAQRGVVTAACVRLGSELGLYDAMRTLDGFTAPELSAASKLNERFVLEWLRQQAACGIVNYCGDERFSLDTEAVAIFADESNPNYMVGALRMLPHTVAMFENAAAAFHTGLGKSYADSSPDRIREMSRAPLQTWSRNALVQQALPQMPDIQKRLTRGGMVCDFGCGAGAAPLAIGQAFPATQVHGYDNWEAVLQFAESQRVDLGLDNVEFFNPESHPIPSHPTYDLVLTMDVLHDLPRPDLVARTIRESILPTGAWFIVDMNCAADLDTNLANPMAQMWYAFSIAMCLQNGTSTDDGYALGTTGLPEPRLRDLVIEAGFGKLERVEGLQHPFNAFYIART